MSCQVSLCVKLRTTLEAGHLAVNSCEEIIRENLPLMSYQELYELGQATLGFPESLIMAVWLVHDQYLNFPSVRVEGKLLLSPPHRTRSPPPDE